MNYAKLAFSAAAKMLQQEFGSRQAYERVEKYNVTEGLDSNEIGFIEQQDHFYMASIGENGFPYIQHRGGPAGFVKVLNSKTLAFLDFSGNKQYISVGNIKTNPNVSLIMVSYPHKSRLKIYAKSRIVEIEDNSALFSKINLPGYKHQSERMMILDIQAFDWNCPQHITQRYTTEEIELAYSQHQKYVSELVAENKKLTEELQNLKNHYDKQ